MTSGIVRRGDKLLRPMGSWSPAMHEYLRHLEVAGFGGSPRVLGIEDDREVLTFIDGDVANDPHWRPGHGHRLPPYARTEQALRGAAELIRQLHWAAAGFQPTITNYRFHPYPPKAGEIVSHGDLGPRTPSSAAGYRSRSSTGTPPSPSSRWPTSPQPRGTSSRSPRRSRSPRQDSTRSLTYRHGCVRS